jgi:hypothetical protein
MASSRISSAMLVRESHTSPVSFSTLTNRVMRSRYRDELSDKAQRLTSIISQSREELVMLRKTLVTLVSVAALALGSAAMAGKGGGGRGGGGGGGGGGMGGGGGGGIGGGGGAMGVAHGPAEGPEPGAMSRGFSAPGTFNRAGPMTGAPITRGPMTTGPITRGNVHGWNGQWGNHHDHFHNRFRNRNFFAFGFGGPIYDYAYNSCWVQTYYGWQYVCGDYYGY